MYYNEAVIQKLKQNNVSKNIEKTKIRMERLWKTAGKADRQAVITSANVALVTIQRVYKTGSISAKLVVPLAQTFNINPYYLTGQVDEEGECTEELLKDFLIDCGYRDIVIEHSATTRKKRKKGKQEAVEDTFVEESQDNDTFMEDDDFEDTQIEADAVEEASVEEIPVEETPVEKTLADSSTDNAPVRDSDSQTFIDNMSEDEMIFLLRAALLRAKAGGANAELANKIKMFLLGIE